MSDKINCKENRIYLDHLPRHMDGRCKGRIDWKNSVGYNIVGVYNEKEFCVKIIDYYSENGKYYLKILYKCNKYKIGIGTFSRCQLGNILGKYANEFKIEVGTKFKDDKRDLVITNRKYIIDKNGRERKYYNYTCKKCGWEHGQVQEFNLLRGTGCSCCNGKTIVEGINDISTTNPELVRYFKYPEDAKRYSKGSQVKVKLVCPDCRRIKKIRMDSLYYQGFSCDCGDGLKYPNKFIFNVLEQLNINFETEHTPKWNKLNRRRYDFYFKHNNEDYICEVNGIQHYEESFSRFGGRTLKEEQENDKFKKQLALDNGIKEENYIVIDARESTIKWIRDNENGILNSKLNELFDLSKVDWVKVGEFACKNLVKEVCETWYALNKKLSIKDISKMFNVDKGTVVKYLEKGAELGWCNYNPKEELTKGRSKAGKSNGKPVKIFKNNMELGCYVSISELSRCSEREFGVKLEHTNISAVCLGKKQQYKGFTFEYMEKSITYN